MTLGLTKPLTENNTRNIPGGKERPARRDDNLTAICEPHCLEHMGLDVPPPYEPPWPVTGISLSL
jgi:hypothetical protein